MRWKGLIFLAILIAIIIIAGIIFSDTWIESELESMGTALNGARVDIDNLQVSFTELFVRWDRLQITDPGQTMKNRLQTGECELNFEFLPLFSNKFIVEAFKIKDIRTNTERAEDGRVEKEPPSEEPGVVKQAMNRLQAEARAVVSPRLDAVKKKVNVDSILSVLDIQSVEKIKDLQQQVNQKSQFWQEKFSNTTIEEDLKEVEEQIKSIDVKKISSAENFMSAANKVDNIYKTIKTRAETVEEIKKAVSADITTIRTQSAQVDDWIAEDYSRALALAKIPDINSGNIARLIFGSTLVDQVNTYLNYLAMAREKIHSEDDEEKKKSSPPRLAGQDIYFYQPQAKPDLWIKLIDISGQTESKLDWHGTVKNIVSDQRLTGTPTELSISSKNASGIQLALEGVLNYLQDEDHESVRLTYSGFPLADYRISNARFIPNRIEEGIGSINSNFDLKGDQIDGRVQFSGSQLRFDIDSKQKPQNQFEEIMYSIVDQISIIEFDAAINGPADDLKFSIDSNLDNLLAEKIKDIVGERVKQTKQEIEQKVNEQIAPYRQQLAQLTDDKERSLRAKVAEYEAMIAKETQRADVKKKEIEQAYAKEKSKLEKKVKDLLKF